MKTQKYPGHKTGKLRIVLWLSIAIYTFSLPYVIIIYDIISSKWSPATAGIVPRIIIISAGAAYLFYSAKTHLSLRRIFFLIPCIIIAFFIVFLEPNPNKHIHIPEYVLMAWLLFEAIRIDYSGAGIFVLVFLASSLLGVFDEVMQGIHTTRQYGWPDMLNNTFSSLIGVLSLMGLRKNCGPGIDWIYQLKKMGGSLLIILFGLLNTGLSCLKLFKIKNHYDLWNFYPDWLIALNTLFMIMAFVVLCQLYRHAMQCRDEVQRPVKTAFLWVSLPLAILVLINSVIIYGWVSDVPFQ
ncbi:MAG: VanZ family protein [Desulfobacteraceae bacterium]|nr:VanZ family protein [Desulfobacteraceae bacterium]